MKRSCATCGTSFETGGHGRRYCGRACWPSSRPFADPGPSTEGLADYGELTELLWIAARRGSVSAMVTLLREVRHDESQPAASVIDELAQRSSSGGWAHHGIERPQHRSRPKPGEKPRQGMIG